ncbi:MAG: tyrosine-type recombinase/integrase [Candidatus Contendobacter sp.]|nr:tyrosine-type recombinase/integrase [Candidatus Contendobacter sp.]
MPKRKDQDGLYKRGDSPFWWASYTNASDAQTRRSTEAADRKETEALLAKWKLAAHQEKYWDAPPSHTFDELMLDYLADTQAYKRSAERDKRCTAWFYPHFTGRELTTLTIGDIYAYQRQRREASCQGCHHSPRIILAVRRAESCPPVMGLKIHNPVQGNLPPTSEGRIRWLRPAKAQALIAVAAVEPRSPHTAAFIRMALHTGCRKNEFLGLEWLRVDLQANLIYLEAHHTKTRQRRAVPLNQEARC